LRTRGLEGGAAVGTQYDSRLYETDLRLTKSIKVGRTRLQGMLDVYNAFNQRVSQGNLNFVSAPGAFSRPRSYSVAASEIRRSDQLLRETDREFYARRRGPKSRHDLVAAGIRERGMLGPACHASEVLTVQQDGASRDRSRCAARRSDRYATLVVNCTICRS